MKSVPKRRPADHVNPDLPPERIVRMWGVVEAAQHKSRGGAARWALAAAAVVLLGGAGSFYAFHAWSQAGIGARRASQGERIVADARPTDLTLPDGTSLSLSRASTLSVLETSDQGSTRLRVDRGSVRFEVPHREGREFVVEARDVRVVVRGTRFLVEVKESAVGSEIQVGVERGRVEVQDRKGRVMSTLHANQSWSMQLPPLTQPVLPTAPVNVPVPVHGDAGATGGVEASVDVQVHVDEHKHEEEDAHAHAQVHDQERDSRSFENPTALLELANQARIEGRAREAAEAYERLYTRHPRDPRAGLAAFEFGRIQLDSLHDGRRAELALRFALGHNQGGFAADDAAALRIDALARLGRLSACHKARTSFFATYPASAHTKRVLAACPE